MIKKVSIITSLILMLLVIAQSGFSQETKALTLQECIEIALQNNSSLRIADYQVKSAGTNVATARSYLLPSINSSFSSGKSIQGARTILGDVPVGFDPETGATIYERREILQDGYETNYHSARISLDQNIFDFGRSYNYLKATKANRKSAQHTLMNTRNLVISNVKQAYYDLLKQYRLKEVYEEAVKVSQEQVDRVQTMMEIGLASQAEVYQARVTLGSGQTTLINQVNNIEIYKANPNNALGRYPSTSLEIIEDKEETFFPEYNFDQAVEMALQNNEELKAMDQEVRANQYNIRYAKSAYMPRIGGSASYSRNNDDAGRVYTSELDKDFSVNIGASLNLNIFNGFADKAAVQRNTINYNIAIENFEEAKRQLLSNVKQYFLQLQAYKDILEINKQNIEAYEENLRLQMEKRRVGSGTELEVSQAQYELTQAKSNLVQAEYNAKVARAQLEAVLGIIEQK